MEINYGIVAVLDDEIVHFVGYEELPQKEDINSLRKELETNPEFGLIEHKNKFKLIHATKEIMDHVKSLETEQ